jgi:hypothetical protein
MNRHLVVKMFCFSAIAPALPYYRPSMDISAHRFAVPALPYYRPSMDISAHRFAVPALPYYRPSMDICVAELRNSPAHYAFMALIPRLESEHFNRQSVRPRLNQRFPGSMVSLTPVSKIFCPDLIRCSRQGVIV